MSRAATEVDLARPLISWLLDMEWDVHQEVQVFAYDRRADIVALRGPLVWVIETKRSMCLRLLEQAEGWLGWGHYLSVATPNPTGRGTTCWIRRTLANQGIGWLVAQGERVREDVPPRLWRKAPYAAMMRGRCNDGTRRFAEAGNAEGRYWTPFQQTCDEVRRYVVANPGATMRDVVANVETHYRTTATARSALTKWIGLGKVRGVRVEHDGRMIRLYPAEGSFA